MVSICVNKMYVCVCQSTCSALVLLWYLRVYLRHCLQSVCPGFCHAQDLRASHIDIANGAEKSCAHWKAPSEKQRARNETCKSGSQATPAKD